MLGRDVFTYIPSLGEVISRPKSLLVAAPLPVPADRFELAPGIWIVREKQWWPISVLDTGHLAPPLADVEPVRRIFPYVEWHQLGNCVAADPPALAQSDAIFFGVDDEHHPALPPTAIEAARAKCHGCPVARTCLTWALEKREEFGIWGGTTGRQRAKLQARIKRGATVEQLVDECLPA